MTTVRRSTTLTVAFAFFSLAAIARTPAPTTQTPASSTDTASRRATTTFFGDTGIWYVPTGEVLAGGQWSAIVYRRGTKGQRAPFLLYDPPLWRSGLPLPNKSTR